MLRILWSSTHRILRGHYEQRRIANCHGSSGTHSYWRMDCMDCNPVALERMVACRRLGMATLRHLKTWSLEKWFISVKWILTRRCCRWWTTSGWSRWLLWLRIGRRSRGTRWVRGISYRETTIVLDLERRVSPTSLLCSGGCRISTDNSSLNIFHQIFFLRFTGKDKVRDFVLKFE